MVMYASAVQQLQRPRQIFHPINLGAWFTNKRSAVKSFAAARSRTTRVERLSAYRGSVETARRSRSGAGKPAARTPVQAMALPAGEPTEILVMNEASGSGGVSARMALHKTS